MSENSRKPNILLIQDGNRRWSRDQDLSIPEGYRVMVEKLAWVADALHDRGFDRYAFETNSTANLQRPPEEVAEFFRAYLLIPELAQTKLKIELTGNLELIPAEFQPRYRDLAEETAKNREFTLTYLMNWSLADELGRLGAKLGTELTEIDERSLAKQSDIGYPIDLVIQTGRRRHAGLPLAAEGAVICFLDIYFPEITGEHLDEALEYYQKWSRERRNGI